MEIQNIELPVGVAVEKAIAVETPREFYSWDFNNPLPLIKKEALKELQPEDYTKY